MAYEGYSGLVVSRDAGVADVTIDNGPINLFDGPLILEMARLAAELRNDERVKVIVFRSANPDFFIAHLDVDLIRRLPTEEGPKAATLNFFQSMVDGFRTMPKVSIAQIEGRTRGGGSEFVLSLDMRFAAIGRAVLGQPEVALGITPGGGATQRLPRLVGRGRALEIILGCGDYGAEEAERYGYVNRALPPDEIGPFVERLARRIASYPAEAIALAKEAVNAAELPTAEGLLEEARCFDRSLGIPAARRRMATFMEDLAGQTPQSERELQGVLEALAGRG